MPEYNIELKKPIRGLAKSECEIEYYIKYFWLKQEDSVAQTNEFNFIRTKEKSLEDPWYPLIRKINHYKEKEVSGSRKILYYSQPSFYQQQFYNDKPPLKEIKEENVNVTGNRRIELNNNNLYIGDEFSTKTIDDNEFKVPDKLSLYDEDGNSLTPINWHKVNSIIYTYENLSGKAVYADYVYETNYFDYRGYWLDENRFVTLNLNTNPGHTYTDIYPYQDREPEVRPVDKEDPGLVNQTIYFYMKPHRIEQSLYDLGEDYKCDILTHPRLQIDYTIYFEDSDGNIEDEYHGSSDVSNLDDVISIANGSEIYNEVNLDDKSYNMVIENNSPRSEDIEILFSNNKKEMVLEYTDGSHETSWFIEAESIYEYLAKEIEVDTQNPLRIEELPSFNELNLEDNEITYNENREYPYEIVFEISDEELPEQDSNLPTPTVEWEISEDKSGYSPVYSYNTGVDQNDSIIVELFDPQNDDYIESEYIYKENRSTVFHTVGEALRPNHPFIKDDINDGYYNFSDILHLGKIHISSISDTSEITTKDTRTRGGGIKEEAIEDIMDNLEHRLALYDYDNIDGKPYPRTNNVIVEIPKEILEKHGGYLTEEDVQNKVEKYVAEGNIPIIIYK